MASSEIVLLIPTFRKKIKDLLTACKDRGIQIEVLKTIISPSEQARLWQQGRTSTESELKALALDHANAPYLANCIRNSKPQETNLCTNDLPGFSWYQWGEAVYCVWVDGTNKLNWSNKTICAGVNGYQILNEEATKLDLFHNIVSNWHHISFRSKSPDEIFTIPQIDAEMKKRFRK